MKFLARPAQDGRLEELLRDHLKSVARRAEENIPQSFTGHEKLREVAEICGLCHDFGKYTTYFQEKLPPLEKPPSKKEYGHHSFISALLAAYVVRERFPDDIDACLLAYLAVHRHHGRLVSPFDVTRKSRYLKDAPEFNKVGNDSLSRELRAVHEQIHNINSRSHREIILSEMRVIGVKEVADFLSQKEWWGLLSELHGAARMLLRDDSEPVATGRYWSMLVLFSALIDADKYVSASSEITWARPEIPSNLVDEYISKLPPISGHSATSARLGQIRTDVYR